MHDTKKLRLKRTLKACLLVATKFNRD